MKYRISKIIVAGVFAASVSVRVEAATHSKSLVVELPADLPELARRNTEAMYLRETNLGQTLLYLEQDRGRSLGILDVTDPGAIRTVGQASLPAKSPYDFVIPLQGSAVLVCYRDHLEFAIIDFRKSTKPELTKAPELPQLAHAEALGPDGLLFSSTAYREEVAGPQYRLFDVSKPSEPLPLVTIEGVQQRLERRETGTLFLLGNAGLTVIRRPAVEEEQKREFSYTHTP